MKTIWISLKIFLFFTVVTGIIYPLLITGISQVAFPSQANGSLLLKNNVITGSKLIGQQFDSAKYFCSRPSAVSYNPLPSGGTNFGLTNAKLKHSVDSLRGSFIAFNLLDKNSKVPSEMVFSSASGLDPDISVEAALLQVERISKARHFDENQKQEVLKLIKEQTEKPQFLLFGEERINVLLLNLALDNININKN